MPASTFFIAPTPGNQVFTKTYNPIDKTLPGGRTLDFGIRAKGGAIIRIAKSNRYMQPALAGFTMTRSVVSTGHESGPAIPPVPPTTGQIWPRGG